MVMLLPLENELSDQIKVYFNIGHVKCLGLRNISIPVYHPSELFPSNEISSPNKVL